MKYRNKNYIDVGLLPFILVPVIAITIGLTLLGHGAFSSKPPDSYVSPKSGLLAGREDLLADTPEFESGDEALFNFTGDTVLVLRQPDSLPDDEVRVLHKTTQNYFETVDLPDSWLIKLPVDTVATLQASGKLLQYNKAAK